MFQSESVSECLGDFVESAQTLIAEGLHHHSHASDNSGANHTDHSSQDCHHNGGACHSGHLGHSAFTIEKYVSVPADDIVSFRSNSQISANFFNLHANLFRPPIA